MSNTHSGSQDHEEIARRWYFSLLRRELENRGQGVAAAHLHVLLRLDPDTSTGEATGTSLTMQLCQHITDYHSRFNAVSGEEISWYIDALAVDGDRSMRADAALSLAVATARLPENAQLVFSDYETMGDRTLFRARWQHRLKGIPIERDYIEVLVNGKARLPCSCIRVWHTPDFSALGQER